MSFTFLGPDPLETQIAAVLHKLEAGLRPSEIEVAQVDIKEEPGRRGPGGVVEPGDLESEEAAQYLAEEMVCMANTAGGGAIIVGIADNGDRIGTELRAEWLRHRIFELSSNRLTLTIREGDLDGTRLLILTTPEAIEPIRFRNKIKWRVDDNCVEVDATSWYAGRIQRTVDWSSHRSGHTLDDVNPLALEHARRSLRGTSESDDLAESPDNDLVRRLNLTDGEGYLTNAGSLLLVETPGDGIDYIRRNAHGSDSTGRYQGHGAPLLEQLAEVDRASDSANRVVHLAEGFAHNQLRSIPPRPMREAIVNGVVHRDWHSATPTTVEHVGDTITVTSPGGFIGGVSPSNIITHPAVPRYRSLAEALAALNLAEREGIGIDRMVQDMLAQGHQPPHIEETPGPYVRVALVGGEPDSNTVEFLNAIEPTTAAALDSLLILELIIKHGWVDEELAAPVLQRSTIETRDSISRLAQATIGKEPAIVPVKGIPSGSPVAYQLSNSASKQLGHRSPHLRSPEGRQTQLLTWAKHRNRVSTTEAADLADVTVTHAGTLLSRLEADGLLRGSRPGKKGRGFHYLPITQS